MKTMPTHHPFHKMNSLEWEQNRSFALPFNLRNTVPEVDAKVLDGPAVVQLL